MDDVPHHHRRPLVWVVGATCVLAVLTAAGIKGVASESDASDCGADALTLEVAIEAYRAMHDQTPASESDLVSGGLLRSESDAFDVVDGAVVPEPRSGCAAPPAPATVPAAAAAPTTVGTARTSTTSLPAGTCSAVDGALDVIADLDADADPGHLADELDTVASLLREARPLADLSLRGDLADLAAVAAIFSDQATQLSEARRTAVAATAAVIDDVIAAIPGFLRYYYTRELLTSSAPSITAECQFPWLEASAERDVEALASALEMFLRSPLGDDVRFAPLVEIGSAMSDTRGMRPASALTAEFDRCAGDPDADRYGDNPGCDALQDACADRDMLACNDLYFSSPAMSAYEAFGISCGERVVFGDIGFAGYCEELD
jgi:hypothetical protein